MIALKTLQKSSGLNAFIIKATVQKMNKARPTKCVNTFANSSEIEAFTVLSFNAKMNSDLLPVLKIINNSISEKYNFYDRIIYQFN